MSKYNRVFKLTMGTDNAAFTLYPEMEIVRILREVADKIERDETGLFPTRNIYDENGNGVGVYWHKKTRATWVALAGDGS